MAYWWDGNRTERYWVEIRWRPGIGLELQCPLTNEDGTTNAWYDLVGQVRVGDTVYHWNAIEHRFVGRSTAESPATVDRDIRNVRLRGLEPIRAAIDLDVLRSHESELTTIRDRLSADHPGVPLYLPFQFRADGLRLMSNYFCKIPKDVVDLLFDPSGLGEASAGEPDAEDGPPLVTPKTSTRVTFLHPFRPKADTEYLARIKRPLQRRGRKHETLVNNFALWLMDYGFVVGRNAAIDIGLDDPPVVVEAKIITTWPKATREALGQLYEYRYFNVADPKAELIFLASAPVPRMWIDYLEQDRGVGVAWPEDGKTFAVSRFAKHQLHI